MSVQGNTEIVLQLNEFNNDGSVAGSSEKTLTVDQIQDIIDHAHQLMVVFNNTAQLDTDVLDELENAMLCADIFE